MAINALTVSGTGNVQVLIKYTDGSNIVSFITGPTSSISLDTSKTNYKYKVISGTSVTVSCSGITFTQITASYKELVWDFFYQYFYATAPCHTVKALIIGNTTYNFTNSINLTPNSYSTTKVSDEIFKLNNPNITPTSYLQSSDSKTINTSVINTVKVNLVLNIEDLTDDIYLKIVNDANGVEYLVKAGGTLTSATPTGYTPLSSPCSNTSPSLL